MSLSLPTALLGICFATSALAQEAPAQQSLIHVEISGFRSDKGQVLCALFSSADDFPKTADKAVAQARSAITGRHAVCEFHGMASGTYAVSVFHDENSNGKLDANTLGMPIEGVGPPTTQRVILGRPNSPLRRFGFRVGEWI